MCCIVRESLRASGGNPVSAKLVKVSCVVAKCLVAAVRVISPGDPVIARIARDGCSLTVFALNRVEIIVVRICVVDGRAGTSLTRRISWRERKLDLSEVPCELDRW